MHIIKQGTKIKFNCNILRKVLFSYSKQCLFLKSVVKKNIELNPFRLFCGFINVMRVITIGHENLLKNLFFKVDIKL